MSALSTLQSSAAGLDAVVSPRRMRIAVIGCRGVPSNYSGIERIVENLFSHMVSHGHEVSVYCRPQIDRQPDRHFNGIRQIYTPAPGGKNGETVSHSMLSMLHAVTKGDGAGQRFDLISMHAIAPNLATPIATFAGIPVISHVHGLDWQREKWKGIGSRIIHSGEKAMVGHSSAVIVVNRSLQEYYREHYQLETALLPNGIHVTPDDAPIDNAVLEQFGLTQKQFIVCIGRLVPEKRLHDTIAAFSRLKSDFKLAIVGEGKTTADYVASLERAGHATGRVVLTGLQNGAALETLFRQAAVYVTASELEGLPSSLLECMERGTCAVATDIPPHRELLGGVRGYDLLFDVGNVTLLTRHMQYLLDHPNHAAAVGAASREFVRREYAWPVLAEKTEQFYQHVLARHIG